MADNEEAAVDPCPYCGIPQLFTAQQVAEEWEVCSKTVLLAALSGELPHVLVGAKKKDDGSWTRGSKRFSVDNLKAYLKKQTRRGSGGLREVVVYDAES